MARKAKTQTNVDNKIVDNEIKVIDDKDITVLHESRIGRPVKYDSPAELQAIIVDYLDKQKDCNLPITVTGLARACGMTREGLCFYEKKDAFTDTIKQAKMLCEEFAEQSLYTMRNPAGAIFNLKNNWGWKDKQEIETNLNINFSTSIATARQRIREIDS